MAEKVHMHDVQSQKLQYMCVFLFIMVTIVYARIHYFDEVFGASPSQNQTNELLKFKNNYWDPYLKYILPISLVILTILFVFVPLKVVSIKDHFDKWYKPEDIKPREIIQIDATVITGVLIFLTVAIQLSPSNNNPFTISAIPAKSMIVGITTNIVFPFAISAILLGIWGNADKKVNGGTTPSWHAKIGILFMIAGFLWLIISMLIVLMLLS